jgi:hypothetical protein
VNDTTRRYPRTLNEAFTKTAEYGSSIERHTPISTLADYALAVAIGLIGAVFFFYWLSW